MEVASLAVPTVCFDGAGGACVFVELTVVGRAVSQFKRDGGEDAEIAAGRGSVYYTRPGNS